MDKYKFKFTRLQNEIFRLLCIKTGSCLNQREIAKILKVSPTAIANALIKLEKQCFILNKKNKKMNLNLIELNRDNDFAMELKRVDNLKMIYESDVVNILEKKFPGSVIILFGSYSYGEDTINSDIDLAIIGCKEKKLDLSKVEKFFKKEIRINFYEDFNKIHKHLRSNIFNGIVLAGRIGL